MKTTKKSKSAKKLEDSTMKKVKGGFAKVYSKISLNKAADRKPLT